VKQLKTKETHSIMQIICLDIETTGFDSEANEILEIAAIKFDSNATIDKFHNFVNYTEEIPSLIQNLTGITSQDVANAPSLESLKDELINFCGDLPIMGHNINFDINFLKAKGINLPGAALDTMPLSHMVFENIESFSLETLCKKFNTKELPSHRAINDVLANIELFQVIQTKLSNLQESQKNNLLQLSGLNQDKNAKAYHELFEFCFQELQNATQEKPEMQAGEQGDPQSSGNSQKANSKILAVDPNLVRKIKLQKNLIEIKNPNYYINTQAVIDRIKDPTANYYSLLRILSKLEANQPLHIDDINFRSDEFGLISTFCQTHFEEFKARPYICSFETLLTYQKEGQLPADLQVEILKSPYLLESWLKFNEVTIRPEKFESSSNPENTDKLSFIFYHLGKFLESELNIPHGQNYVGPLDKFTLTKREFTDFISEIKKLDLNNQQKALIDKFKLLSQTGYIQLMLFKNQPAIFKAISQDLDIKQEAIIDFLDRTDVKFLDSKSSLDKFEVYQEFIDCDMKSAQYPTALSETLWDALKDTQETALVICPSNDNIRSTFETLCLDFQKLGIQLLAQNMSGSKGKIISNMNDCSSTPKILLCTHHFLLKFHPDLSQVKKVILTKLPIGTMSHFFFRFKEKESFNSFIEYTIPHSSNNFNHLVDHLLENNIQKMFLLDPRVEETNWGRQIKKGLQSKIIFN
jgi:DNA polymerase III epsilon subunit-like protein